jgi:paired amphipathic helix protein Sin3a
MKTTHTKAVAAADAAAVEPNLTPVMPEPVGPTSPSIAWQDDFTFFERVKKHLNNRTALVEFLKLCNMYTQDLIDKNVLIYKASQFIGGQPELLNYLKAYVRYNGEDDTVDNRPEPPTGKVSLSNCRGFGPSYRLLPTSVSHLSKT